MVDFSLQLYEDAIEMQNFFIKTRDELCKNGELLLTPALSYTERHLAQDLEEEQSNKQEQERLEQSQLPAEEGTTSNSDGGKIIGEALDTASDGGSKMVGLAAGRSGLNSSCSNLFFCSFFTYYKKILV